MGMYDTLVCHFPLPVNEAIRPALQKCVFQTKSLTCQMKEYHLMADGFLWLKVRDDGDPDPIGLETPFHWKEVGRSGVGRLAATYPDILFYTSLALALGPQPVEWEFRAKFDQMTHLIELRRVFSEKP